MVGTHSQMNGSGSQAINVYNNGAFKVGRRGRKFAEIQADGSSKCIIITESIEEERNAWVDAASTWVTALQLDGLVAANNGIPTNRTPDGLPDYGNLGVALGFGEGSPSATTDPPPYWGGGDRQFGPSSDHDAVVIHTFGDNHTSTLTVDIEPSVYAALVTINGSENVNLDQL